MWRFDAANELTGNRKELDVRCERIKKKNEAKQIFAVHKMCPTTIDHTRPNMDRANDARIALERGMINDLMTALYSRDPIRARSTIFNVSRTSTYSGIRSDQNLIVLCDCDEQCNLFVCHSNHMTGRFVAKIFCRPRSHRVRSYSGARGIASILVGSLLYFAHSHSRRLSVVASSARTSWLMC